MWYVAKKAADHRFDGEGEFDLSTNMGCIGEEGSDCLKGIHEDN